MWAPFFSPVRWRVYIYSITHSAMGYEVYFYDTHTLLDDMLCALGKLPKNKRPGRSISEQKQIKIYMLHA